MSYGLIDIGLNVDTSVLEQRLYDLEHNTDVLSARLDDISVLTEDRVQELLAEKVEDYVQAEISNQNLASDSTVEDLGERLDKLEQGQDIDELVSNAVDQMDIDDRVRDVLDSGSYIEDGVSQYVRDNDLIDQSTLDQAIDELRDEIPDADELVNEVIDKLPDNEDVEKLQQRVSDLERRFEMYATRVDTLMQANTMLNERLDAALNDDHEKRIKTLEDAMQDGHVLDAVTLFDLLRRAAQILGIGGRA